MLVLVTLLISELDHFISLFRFCSSTWLHYDGQASIKTKMVKRPTILNGKKLGFLIYVTKKFFVHPINVKWNVPWRKLEELIKELIKILKTSIELIQSKQQRHLNHADSFISTFDQMYYFLQVFSLLKQVSICKGV